MQAGSAPEDVLVSLGGKTADRAMPKGKCVDANPTVDAGSYSPTAAPLTPRSESINPRMAKGDKTPHLC